MTLIKKQRKVNFKKLKIEVNEELLVLLKMYSEMVEATPDYVIGEALKIIFSKDKDFIKYVKENGLNYTRNDIENLIVVKTTGERK